MRKALEQCGARVAHPEHAFRQRMESQCQQISHYRLQEMRESGRMMSMDEAALEWIERFAADYDCDSGTDTCLDSSPDSSPDSRYDRELAGSDDTAASQVAR